MSIDDRDYMKNRNKGKDNPYYNPKEFRGSKDRFSNDPWFRRLKNSNKNIDSKNFSYQEKYSIPEDKCAAHRRSKYQTEDVTWDTNVFGFKLKSVLFVIIGLASLLFLFNQGFFDRVLSNISPITARPLQEYTFEPVRSQPNSPPVQLPASVAKPIISNGLYSVARAGNGHFYVPGSVNNSPTVFMVDTGATLTFISSSLAARAGITHCTKQEFMTAMGIDRDACVARVSRLEFGAFYMLNVDIGISKNLSGEALLGMNALRNLRMVQTGDRLVLEK
jgi:clan AA aspartic protease (TIGR02281 family)